MQTVTVTVKQVLQCKNLWSAPLINAPTVEPHSTCCHAFRAAFRLAVSQNSVGGAGTFCPGTNVELL